MTRYFERKVQKLNDIISTAGNKTTKDMIVYKKARYGKGIKAKPCIVKLLIPKGSQVVNRLMAEYDTYFTVSRAMDKEKCRASKAKVLEIRTFNETTKILGRKLRYASSLYIRANVIGARMRTQYRVGQMVYPNGFDESPFISCGKGIHFFVTREEAMDY